MWNTLRWRRNELGSLQFGLRCSARFAGVLNILLTRLLRRTRDVLLRRLLLSSKETEHKIYTRNKRNRRNGPVRMKKHAIRIVGGEYRKTPIAVVDAPGLRPTPDRVRETLFNWLRHFWMSDFHDKRVLDLFAGSGALGFEAASHGA